MRKQALFILAVIFLTNTLALSAWAKPCFLLDQMPQAAAEMTNADMDCHKKKQEQNKTHCEGICLCEHANLSQTPIIEHPHFLKAPLSSFERITEKEQTLISRSTSPLLRPPRALS